MRLGNSGANNKGKKYIKIKEGAVATPENQTKADKFKDWFGKTYTRLQTELINKDTYNEDILNDTFLRIYDKIRFGGLEIASYKAYFHRAFFTNFMQETIKKSRETTITIGNYDTVNEIENNEELMVLKSNLESDILHYVYQRYSLNDFSLFKTYMSLKPTIKYAELSNLTNIPLKLISKIISTIRKDVCSQKDFVIRRKETLKFVECH